MLNTFHLALLCCWLSYVLLHSLLAAAWFKNRIRGVMGRGYPYYRLLYSCFAALSLVAVLAFQYSRPGILLYQPLNWLQYAGMLLATAGLLIMAICVRKYFMNLSGVDVLLKKERPPVLEKGGLHAYVRHPLYAGTLLFIWALFMVFPFSVNLLACSLITVYTLVGIRIEEKKLLLEFGEEYKRYSKNTSMLIPFVT